LNFSINGLAGFRYAGKSPLCFVPIRTNAEIYIAARKIPLLKWPAISPYIEDLWGILPNKVYKNGRQFDTVNNLKKALFKEWDQINPTTLQNLATSTANRINTNFY